MAFLINDMTNEKKLKFAESNINIEKIYTTGLVSTNHISRKSLLITGALMKARLWRKLIDSGFIREWFEEFHEYWISVLKGRPLKFHDFFYLHSESRKGFEDTIQFESYEMNDENVLERWQVPENIYLLYSGVYNYALQPVSYYPFRKIIAQSKKVLEYGCGVAPITYSAIKYGHFNKSLFTIGDIHNHTFHFAKWRLKNTPNVRSFDIEPHILPDIEKDYDTVFLMTVLEHLHDPLNTLINIADSIKPGGHLVFDFILGDGKGLDTKQAVEKRRGIIDYLKDSFTVVFGELSADTSMRTTIVRKKVNYRKLYLTR